MIRLLDYLLGLVSLLRCPLSSGGDLPSPQRRALEARLETTANTVLQRAGIDWAWAEMSGQKAILTGAAPSLDAVDEAARIAGSSGPGGILMGGGAGGNAGAPR